MMPLLGRSSRDWPLSSTGTSKAFRARMRSHFQSWMKPSTGLRHIHLQGFKPFFVFVDVFASIGSARRTPTFFTLRNVMAKVFSGLVDDGWGTCTTHFGDVIRCTVACPGVIFGYRIGKPTLYVTFE